MALQDTAGLAWAVLGMLVRWLRRERERERERERSIHNGNKHGKVRAALACDHHINWGYRELGQKGCWDMANGSDDSPTKVVITR